MDRTELADLTYLAYAERISGDYIDFVKKSVLPTFNTRYPLKLRETRVLNAIAAGKGDINGSDVSDALRQDPATITRSTVILTGQGYITSVENLRDGRSRLLIPTEKGYAAATYFLDIFTHAEAVLSERHVELPVAASEMTTVNTSLDRVARRAQLFRDSQRELRRLLQKHAGVMA